MKQEKDGRKIWISIEGSREMHFETDYCNKGRCSYEGRLFTDQELAARDEEKAREGFEAARRTYELTGDVTDYQTYPTFEQWYAQREKEE